MSGFYATASQVITVENSAIPEISPHELLIILSPVSVLRMVPDLH
jgi:hypothetical protein